MSLISSIRRIPLKLRQKLPQPSFAYVDTPDFAYDQWLEHLARNNQPIGTVADPGSPPKIAIIGAGASGLCAAYELVRAGYQVDVFEAGTQVGGRCDSTYFSTDPGGPDLAELGAMRFPPSEFALDFYMKAFGLINDDGIMGLPLFPDPGVVQTLVSYADKQQLWISSEAPYPEGFETVFNGWTSFIEDGLEDQSGTLVLQSATTITRALLERKIDLATQYWQEYLDAFGQVSFYAGLNEIFTGTGRYRVPGGTPWTFEDFDRFGSLGLGSGGFGPLYPIGFNEIFRLIPNEFETAQRFFQPGIRQLPISFNDALASNALYTLFCGHRVDQILSTGPKQFALVIDKHVRRGYDRVIVATTTRAMEVSLNLPRPQTQAQPALVSQDVAAGIMRTHVTASNKLAARIHRYWDDDPSLPRCFIGDNILHQIYTIDYGNDADNSAVCFLTYSWDDDAVKQQSLAADPGKFYKYLLGVMTSAGGLSARLADKLIPLNGDFTNNVMFMGWQLEPGFSGAFKLAEPGQDEYVREMFYDFQKCLEPDSDTGVYVAGDCVHWTAGWVEGALEAGLNAAAGVIKSLGGAVNPDAKQRSPLTLDPNRYTYFNGDT